jgi:Flp pilus assembly protein TadD
MLERDAGAPGSRVDALLEKTIELDPAFGEAHFLLGLHMTDSDPENAVQHLTAAARASPGKSYVWHALGYAQMRLGDTGSARLSASRALQTSATEQEERMAKALLDSLK